MIPSATANTGYRSNERKLVGFLFSCGCLAPSRISSLQRNGMIIPVGAVKSSSFTAVILTKLVFTSATTTSYYCGDEGHNGNYCTCIPNGKARIPLRAMMCISHPSLFVWGAVSRYASIRIDFCCSSFCIFSINILLIL